MSKSSVKWLLEYSIPRMMSPIMVINLILSTVSEGPLTHSLCLPRKPKFGFAVYGYREDVEENHNDKYDSNPDGYMYRCCPVLYDCSCGADFG